MAKFVAIHKTSMMKLQPGNRLMPALAIGMLIMIFASVVIAFMVRKEQKAQIAVALKILEDGSRPVALVENTLESLFIAENEFKEYALSYDQDHFTNYKLQISRLVQSIDALQVMVKTFNHEEKGLKTHAIIEERNREANSYIRLKRLTDSIMIISANIEMVPFEKPNDVFALKKITSATGEIVIDTLDFNQSRALRKKGLLGKIKTFLVGEEEQETTNSKVVVKSGQAVNQDVEISETTDTTFSYNRFAEDIINKSNTYYQRQLRSQLERRKQLRDSEIRLVRLNGALMTEIREILVSLKGAIQNNIRADQSQSTTTIARSTNILQNVLLMAITAAIMLAIATAWMIYKNQGYQARIIESRHQALAEAAEKRRFLAYMSHEFRTPLSSVSGFAEQLEQTKLSKEQLEYLSGIIASSEILLTTVNDILDLSKLEAGKMNFMLEPFLPGETINQLIRAFRGAAAEKGLTLVNRPLRNDVVLLGDEIRLRQILNNLLSNAIKYTHKGSVEIEAIIADNGKEGHWLTVKVSDTGIGIPAEHLSEIFNEYTRVHAESASRWVIGTGLGLPVTKRLIDALGGDIEVSSRVGKGSELIVRLPYSRSNVDLVKKQPIKSSINLKDSGIKILIADDNYFNILLLKSIFKRTGIEVDIAENGNEALEQLNKGDYNMLLSDMYMPGMDGLELTRSIRNEKRSGISQLPVIMITGNVSVEARVQMKEAGVNDYLFKPFQQADLLGIVGKYLN
ncbi:MAG: response regulator [Lentimicrobium sp.]|jgi:signal transduction histidine kinase/CheY-like chemotaxis protein|nr:response regulator [Lentimicrobium sp.]